jgi:hypothetical protein
LSERDKLRATRKKTFNAALVVFFLSFAFSDGLKGKKQGSHSNMELVKVLFVKL